jgi:hypothetical protein
MAPRQKRSIEIPGGTTSRSEGPLVQFFGRADEDTALRLTYSLGGDGGVGEILFDGVGEVRWVDAGFEYRSADRAEEYFGFVLVEILESPWINDVLRQRVSRTDDLDWYVRALRAGSTTTARSRGTTGVASR